MIMINNADAEKYPEILNALAVSLSHLERALQLWEHPSNPAGEHIATNIRMAIVAAEVDLKVVLEKLVGPVWGSMSEDAKAACRAAGM